MLHRYGQVPREGEMEREGGTEGKSEKEKRARGIG